MASKVFADAISYWILRCKEQAIRMPKKLFSYR